MHDQDNPPIGEAVLAALKDAGLSAVLLLAPAALLGAWPWPAGLAFVAV
jgi:hypothetical protein